MKNKYRVTRDGKLIMNIKAESEGQAIALVQADFREERFGKKKLTAIERTELSDFISGNWEARKILIQRKPRFEVGDIVSNPKNLYNETRGEVTHVERIFQEVNPDGSFDMNGLATLEGTISSIQVPYDFDGETLKIHLSASSIKLKGGDELKEKAKTRTSKFYGYAYTVTTPKMNSVFSETSLTIIQKVNKDEWNKRAHSWYQDQKPALQDEILKAAKIKGIEEGQSILDFTQKELNTLCDYLRGSRYAILVSIEEPVSVPAKKEEDLKTEIVLLAMADRKLAAEKLAELDAHTIIQVTNEFEKAQGAGAALGLANEVIRKMYFNHHTEL